MNNFLAVGRPMNPIRSNVSRSWRLLPRMAAALLLCGLLPALGWSAPNPTKVTGPDNCKDCHESAFYAWKETHHHQTLTMLYSNKVQDILTKMDLRSARGEDCRDCHFTPMTEDGKTNVFKTFGTSCESCHGAAREWFDKHGAKGQSREQIQELFRKCDGVGMVRPANIYSLAAACFGCHIVADEKVVNVGGHSLGGDFDLVARTQGEVRHNFSSNPKVNAEAKPERKRQLFVLGRLLDLEYSLRAAAKATKEGKFATEAASRVNKFRSFFANATASAWFARPTSTAWRPPALVATSWQMKKSSMSAAILWAATLISWPGRKAKCATISRRTRKSTPKPSLSASASCLSWAAYSTWSTACARRPKPLRKASSPPRRPVASIPP
ncbi:MAG: hypothetical protein DME25_13560 [Verrucomicrobia bacterium]|nr:MAG: hypothetical protein DME25_13560 [Verrucomicrobiota bacterium]